MKINGTALTANIVAGSAFLASAQHIYSVAHHAGNPMLIAGVHAIGIDGLILIGINSLGRTRFWGITSIIYGAVVSLLFNAASYGAFTSGPLPHEANAPATATYGMPAWVLAVTMPAALVIAYVTHHASQRPKDAGQDKATETAVDVHVRRRTVPAERPVQATASVPVPRPTVPAAVVQPTEVVPAERPAIADRPAGRRAPLWTSTDEAKIRAMIEAGSHSDRAIAREVFGEDATDATRKRIERFRRSVTGTN